MPSPARVRRPAWAGRNYTLLTAAAVVTGLGNSGALVAAAFAVLESGGSGTDVGLVAAARTVPLVVFLLIGGAVADRLPRHRVMVAANALNCVSQTLFGLLVLSGEALSAGLWPVLLLSALGGTGHAFFAPAAEGMLLATVSGEHSARAFAFFRMGMSGANIGGAALGGLLVAAAGPGWVLVLDGAAFAVAAALRAFLDIREMPERPPAGGLPAQLREGWREVAGRTWLWAVVLQFAVINAVVGAAEAVYGPLVAQERLGGARSWGLALAAFGAGTVLGALLMTRLKPRRMLFTGSVAVFVLALPSAALAVPVPVWALCLVMLVSGVAVEVFAVGWMTALHQEIPEDKLSRVSSYDWFGSVAMVPVATALAGPAADLFGREAALWGCSALIVLLTAAVLTVPDVRNLTRRGPGAAAPGTVDALGGKATAALPAAPPVPPVPTGPSAPAAGEATGPEGTGPQSRG
ncbi:MFS transporter [Streptomyces zingiberis]|uniref:MFS transporter n=1 Tax=Streptomyces zingiberis TaxID=2053010 RepID=A0ABX1C0U1_9ACTN|nr:MFS transporter [Streptomyces zingiberis]NJQ01582.1 MFS transporter [Streptomyces zingiberis]